MSVYLALAPETEAPRLPRGGSVLISTALSGGTLRELLSDAVRRYGAKRVALDVRRLRMEFPLPCPSGEGKPLTGEAFEALRARSGAPSFFSRELCAKYFTCAVGTETRLILYDDAETIREKLRLARSLGIEDALFNYAEVADIWGELFPA